jgi:putative ABC transport system permease protein
MARRRGAAAGARAPRARRLPPFVVDILIALRNVVRQPRRSAMGFIAVGGGVLAFLLAAGFIEWMYWGLREGTIRSGLGHLQVVAKGYRDDGRADPYRYLLSDASPALTAITDQPEVVTVAPRLAFSGLASRGEVTVSFIGEGIVPEREQDLARTVTTVEGQPLASDDPDGIALGRGLADALGARVGDKVVLIVNSSSGGVGGVEGHVRGLFTTITKAYDDTALRVTMPLARRLLKVEGSHAWVVLLRDTATAPAVSATLRSKLAASRLEVTPWYELADFYNKTVTLLSRQVGVVKWMIGIIIVLGISNTLMMNVMERTGEIGTALALGGRRASILRRFIAEGVVIGALGGAAGVIAGCLLARAISAIGIPMPPSPGMTQGYVGEILVTWPIIVDALVLAFVTTLAASVYPAWKASRMNIVDALRRQR